jgi:gamma-glutamyltranspeptidase/glutathione hydrolase
LISPSASLSPPDRSSGDQPEPHFRHPGLVVAAHGEAASAGSLALEKGGTAVDAAVAAALALCVVDPANCGIGGYGGFMVVQPAPGQPVHRVDFNTFAPKGFTRESLAGAPRLMGFVKGGPSVSVPAVVPGLAAAHAKFGRLSFESLVEPALRLAREGLPAGHDLVRSLDAVDREGTIASDMFGCSTVQVGQLLRQPLLADTLEDLASRGPSALQDGPLVIAMCEAAQRAGGSLAPQDFQAVQPRLWSAVSTTWAGATVHVTDREESGAGVLLEALDHLDPSDVRGSQFSAALTAALQRAWKRRREAVRPLVAWPGDTTHLCATDAQAGLVSLTFTHGPLWFGSGIVAGKTGVLLNAGANVLARFGDRDEIRAAANVAPVIVEAAEGIRHALGSPGGHRIPAIVLGAVVDIVARGATLQQAFARPRIAVTPGGDVEAEPGATLPAPRTRSLKPSDFYGPATGVTLRGQPVPALDPRFQAAVASPHDYDQKGPQL